MIIIIFAINPVTIKIIKTDSMHNLATKCENVVRKTENVIAINSIKVLIVTNSINFSLKFNKD